MNTPAEISSEVRCTDINVASYAMSVSDVSLARVERLGKSNRAVIVLRDPSGKFPTLQNEFLSGEPCSAFEFTQNWKTLRSAIAACVGGSR